MALRHRESGRAKRLLLEPLESRNLLAADCMPELVVEEPIPTNEMLPAPALVARTELTEAFVPDPQTLQATAGFSASNGDAGSTRATAHDLGTLEPTNHDRSLRGSLSFRDRSDVFRFELPTAATTEINISGMFGNADLLLADADGRGIQLSRNSGFADENIRIELEAGVYYIGVLSRSFFGTGYQLDLAAEFAAPQPEQETGEEEGEAEDAPENGSGTPPLPDVPYFGGRSDWNINSVNAPEAWAAGYTGQGITVAVVDTGVDLDHPDLVNNIYVNPGEIPGNGIDDDQNGFVDDVSGYDFVSDDADPNDRNGHGTHVAGTIASANNGFGSTGIAPDAKILPVKVLSDNGSGSTFSVAAGIRYAADMGADVINLSLGGGFSRTVQAAVSYANSLGSVVIAAAGNEGAGQPSFPARLASTLTNVISVGAHDSNGRIAGFSNSVGGSNALQIDAPGVGIYSTYAGGRFGNLSGTSMASPHVAGVAALALSANPNLSPSELRGLLADGVTRQSIGSDAVGMVNAATTVAYAAAGLTSASGNATSSNASGFAGNARSSRAISIGPGAILPIAFTTTQLGNADDGRLTISEFGSDLIETTSETSFVVSTSDSRAFVFDTLASRDEYFADFATESFEGLLDSAGGFVDAQQEVQFLI